MTDLLHRLDKWIRANRPAYYKLLRPGVQKSDLAQLEESLGYSLPPSFHELYLWKDGQDQSGANAFQYNRDFMSLETARQSHQICQDCVDDWEPKENMWSERWFPFLEHWGGDLLCVDLEGSFGGNPGQILYFYHDSDDRTITLPSLEAWMESFVVTLEAGMWEENEYGFQPVKDDEDSAVFKKMFPGYPRYEEAG